jgi:hypothetical protein
LTVFEHHNLKPLHFGNQLVKKIQAIRGSVKLELGSQWEIVMEQL